MLKKIIVLSSFTASLLATNGINMIATDTVGRSMGGTGVANYSSGAAALGKNIALMGNSKTSEFQFDITYFNASVSSTIQDDMPVAKIDPAVTGESTNHLETNFIPSMAYVMPINDKMNFGVAMIGAAGMGVDYIETPELHKMKTAMLFMKIVPGISYAMSDSVNFGIAPVLGLGSLSINYDDGSVLNADGSEAICEDGHLCQSTRPGLFGTNVGGETLVPSFGYTLGMDVKVAKNLRVGVAYNSSMSFTYEKVANFAQFGMYGALRQTDQYLKANTAYKNGLTDLVGGGDDAKKVIDDLLPASLAAIVNGAIGAGADFVNGALKEAKATDENLDDLTLEQPWEIALGVAYDPMENMTITGDYRYIAWGDATGYKDFGWSGQHVFALGFELRRGDLKIRGGYNYAATPLADSKNDFGGILHDVQGTLVFQQALQMLNTVGFPAIAESHYTFGLGYDFTKNLNGDFGMMFSPETQYVSNGYFFPDVYGDIAGTAIKYQYETKMAQMTVSAGINYRW